MSCRPNDTFNETAKEAEEERGIFHEQIDDEIENIPKELANPEHWVNRIIDGAINAKVEEREGIGEDSFELMCIAKRRGVEWVKKELKI